MRSFSLLAAVAGLAFSSSASAHLYYIAPPTAPDMLNPGFYYTNPYGVVYGPNHCVRPPFPPYQGVIPGPPKGRGPSMAQYSQNPQAFNGAMQQYQQAGGFGGAPGGFPGFARNPWFRSPRDFFMYDSEPLVSPYNYGAVGGFGLYGDRRDVCD